MISVQRDQRMGSANLLVSSSILPDVGQQVGAESFKTVTVGQLIPDALDHRRGLAAAA